ncbi:HNH endonuclease [Paracoccus methylarcula]|uniref:HNH endonuclease n=1 Tax=Paracoccus methylarcula TaxID=72022 RepID=UPI0034503F8E
MGGEERFAHRLVAFAFLPDPLPEQTQVAHRDGSRLHCHWQNLRWSTPLENHDDRRRHGTGPVGERNPKAKLTEDDVRRIRREYRLIKIPGSGRSVSELENAYGVHRATICSIANGRSWKHVKELA